MTVTPPSPDAGKAAGKGGVALGARIAIAVAALFLILTGANRTGRPATREGYPHPHRPPPSYERRRNAGTPSPGPTVANPTTCANRDPIAAYAMLLLRGRAAPARGIDQRLDTCHGSFL
jgi:hypothetical protein